ncbi:hypothetical protein BDN71DRAFT_532336 [Pleurotus eryngii]|uniref:Uncharacterized protein n=1 Tax=Pleurotus eryngii TaxID=5323 RepID=A0A9P6DAS6_PLEER|nr:hypothetical protein BDN71DRAFT_532336 [Pleurotus eryngii]
MPQQLPKNPYRFLWGIIDAPTSEHACLERNPAVKNWNICVSWPLCGRMLIAVMCFGQGKLCCISSARLDLPESRISSYTALFVFRSCIVGFGETLECWCWMRLFHDRRYSKLPLQSIRQEQRTGNQSKMRPTLGSHRERNHLRLLCTLRLEVTSMPQEKRK